MSCAFDTSKPFSLWNRSCKQGEVLLQYSWLQLLSVFETYFRWKFRFLTSPSVQLTIFYRIISKCQHPRSQQITHLFKILFFMQCSYCVEILAISLQILSFILAKYVVYSPTWCIYLSESSTNHNRKYSNMETYDATTRCSWTLRRIQNIVA